MEWLIVGIVGAFLLAANPSQTVVDTMIDKKAFIKKIAAAALPVAKATGIPISIIVAQAIHESNYGASGLAVQARNLFGIKASPDWTGPAVMMPTYEVINGKEMKVNAFFRSYDSYEGSVKDWYEFIKKPRYSAALAAALTGNATQFFQELQKAGYATDPGYASKLAGVLNSIKNEVV